MKNVYLVGMPASGKSTIGKKLSQILNKKFLDTDVEIEKLTSLTIPEFFSHFGEKSFRELEHKVLLSTFEQNNCIVATGGGLAAYHNNMALMLEKGFTVFVDVPLETLVERILKEPNTRPLYPPENLSAVLKTKLEQRIGFYSQAQMVVKPSDDLLVCANFLAALLN
jgi:shikimate kinase